jgi:3-dehydroquinate dehydratase II
VKRFLVINGPNLNLLGSRDPATYGSTTLAELEVLCRTWGAELGVSVQTFQSNHEGGLIDRLHEARDRFDGIVFNPGAYTHTSYALHDALDAIEVPTVEVHISNVAEREPWRRKSVVRPACVATIYGRGVDGYRWGMRHLFHRAEWPVEQVSYADHPDAVIDLRRPEGPGPHPAVVLVHGGFWRHQWTRDVMEGIAIDLTRRGFLTANVEYRRVGTGGGWPATVDDVASAIRAVARMADVGPVTVLGHSAGGHLAVAAHSRLDFPFRPVSLAGILDLEAALAEDLGGGAVAAFLGGSPPETASPTRMDADFEVTLVHGTSDDRVPISQTRAYAASHPLARAIELDGVGHFDLLERSHPAWLEVAKLLAGRQPADERLPEMG